MNSETRKVKPVVASATHLALRPRRRIVAAQEQRQDHRADQRDEGGERKDVAHDQPPSVTQVRKTAIPITMAKA